MANGVDIIGSASSGEYAQTGISVIGASVVQIGHDRPLQRGVFMRISPLNAGTIFVGFDGDIAHLGVTKGFGLFYFPIAGGSGFGEIDIPIDNMKKLFFKASSAGQVLTWYSL